MQEDLLQEPRPSFKGTYKPNKVTGKLEPTYSEWKRVCFRYFITLPCLFMTILFTIAIMLMFFSFQSFIRGLIGRFISFVFNFVLKNIQNFFIR